MNDRPGICMAMCAILSLQAILHSHTAPSSRVPLGISCGVGRDVGGFLLSGNVLFDSHGM